MIQIITKLYEGANLSGAVSGVIYLPILDARTLIEIKVKTDENIASANAVFQLKKNGTVITGAEAITISVGNKIGTVSSLAIALAEGDELLLDLTSGAVSSPVTLNLSTTKTVGTDEITEVTDKKFVTDAEKVKLSNLSNTNSGDETALSIGTILGTSANKTTPVDADYVGVLNFASGTLQKLSWANLKATLKTYFDTLYQAVLVSGTNIKSVNGTSLLGSGNLTIASGSTLSVTTVSVTTGSLANLGNETGTISLGKVFALFVVEADKESRVRIYQTAAFRDADNSRAIGVAPSGEHGLISEDIPVAANLKLNIPAIVGFDAIEPQTGAIAYNIQNRSGSTSTVTVTFTVVKFIS